MNNFGYNHSQLKCLQLRLNSLCYRSLAETELSLSPGKMEKKKSAPKDINDNEAFEPQIVVNDIAGKAPGKEAEETTVPTTTLLKEATADKILEERSDKLPIFVVS